VPFPRWFSALALGAAVCGCSEGHAPVGGTPQQAAGGGNAAVVGGASGAAGANGGQPLIAAGGTGSGGVVPTTGGAASPGGNGGSPPIEDDDPSAGAAGSAGEGPAPSGVPGIIAVGYGGLRLVSRDLGQSWHDETHWSENGGDDQDLLRTVAYGNGVWLSAGWRLVTSIDGVSWSDRGMADDVIAVINCPVTDGLAFGAGQFLVACGSNLASSSDGLTWQKVGPTPNVGKHPYLFWEQAAQRFVCSGDDGPSFTSSDGKAWTKLAIDKAHLCEGGVAPKSECSSFYTQGVFLTTEWGGVIRRSTNGESFEKTYQDQFENNLFTEYSFGVGSVAP